MDSSAGTLGKFWAECSDFESEGEDLVDADSTAKVCPPVGAGLCKQGSGITSSAAEAFAVAATGPD